MKETTLRILLTALATLLLSPLAHAQGNRWRGPDGDFLPFTTDEEVLEFLREAEIVQRKKLKKGINKHLKVRLSRDGVEANAVFRTTNVRKPRHTSGDEVYIDVHDSYTYECAAYEVSRLLGLDNVPPCVLRDQGKRRGTMQLWIEGTVAEDERRRAKQQAPSSIRWARQQQVKRLFDGLIYNFDRNQGNMLFDADWKLWLIDHGLSFHESDRVPDLERIIWCERGLWTQLRALDRETLDRHLGDLVEEDRIAFVVKRRDVLVRHLEERIAELGEDVVLYDLTGEGPSG